MKFKLKIFFPVVIFIAISCNEKKYDNSQNDSCLSNVLKNSNIKADISISSNNYRVILKKPYKTVDSSHQKLLVESLLNCFSVNENTTIEFEVLLDKEMEMSKNKFIYSNKEISKIKKREEKIKLVYNYILNSFKKEDIIVLNNFIEGFYKSYPYKEDIYNVDFIQLIEYLYKEKNKDDDRAKLTFLLLYGTSKESNTKDLKDASLHLKTIWNYLIVNDIDQVLKQTFG